MVLSGLLSKLLRNENSTTPDGTREFFATKNGRNNHVNHGSEKRGQTQKVKHVYRQVKKKIHKIFCKILLMEEILYHLGRI